MPKKKEPSFADFVKQLEKGKIDKGSRLLKSKRKSISYLLRKE